MIRTNKYDNCLAVLITCIVWILMQLQLNPQKIVNENCNFKLNTFEN